jgi:hypothetical protein
MEYTYTIEQRRQALESLRFSGPSILFDGASAYRVASEDSVAVVERGGFTVRRNERGIFACPVEYA